MRLIAYARVSTDEQADEGVSLAAQRDKLAAWTARPGVELVDVVADEGVSAATLDRPALRGALSHLVAGLADGLVVTKLDRLTRSVHDWQHLLDDHFRPGRGRHLYVLALGGAVDTATAHGRLMLNILVAMGECERDTGLERTADAVEHKRAKGHRLGQVPYGKRLAADGVTLEDDPFERDMLRTMHRLRGAGNSFARVAEILTAMEVPTKRGDGRAWSASTVRVLLKGGDDGPSPDRSVA